MGRSDGLFLVCSAGSAFTAPFLVRRIYRIGGGRVKVISHLILCEINHELTRLVGAGLFLVLRQKALNAGCYWTVFFFSSPDGRASLKDFSHRDEHSF